MDGFIILDKEQNMTSFDCVAKCRKIFKTKAVGHTGTLDPMTTGVLVIALNKATKLMDLMLDKKKKYRAEVTVGIQTDTLDIFGENILIDEKVTNLDKKELLKQISFLEKSKTQLPPMYSAIKINGKKLYEYARNNIEVKREERAINIDYIKLLGEIRYEDRIKFEIEVLADSGIYIRTLIDDLGKLMNTTFTMSNLVRLQSGNFKIEDARKLKDLEEGNYKLITIAELFKDSPKIEVNDYIAKLVKNGVMLDSRQATFNEVFRVYHNNELIAIYKPFKEGYKIVVYLGE